jgi:hypothetical protein
VIAVVAVVALAMCAGVAWATVRSGGRGRCAGPLFVLPAPDQHSYLQLGPVDRGLGIGFPARGLFQPGVPLKVGISGPQHSFARARVELTGERCSDGARLYFAYRDYQLPDGVRITERSAARFGDAVAVFQLGRSVYGQQYNYTGYMLFPTRGDYGLTLRRGSKRIGDAVVRIS